MNDIIEKLKKGHIESKKIKMEAEIAESGMSFMNPPVSFIYADMYPVKTVKHGGHLDHIGQVQVDELIGNVFVRTRDTKKETSVILYYYENLYDNYDYKPWRKIELKKLNTWCDCGVIWTVNESSDYFSKWDCGRPTCFKFFPGFNKTYGGEIRFAIEYREGDDTYWDNNNGWNYNIVGTCCEGFYYMKHDEIYHVGNPSPYHKERYSVNHPRSNVFLHMQKRNQIFLRNIAAEKKVTVVYTEDNWENISSVEASFKHMLLGDTWEVWTFNLPVRSSTTVFYITYEANGEIYYDNNFGSNYKFSNSLAGSGLKGEECLYKKTWTIDNGVLNKNSFK